MFKQKYLGYFLLGLGGITSALVVLMFFISRDQGLVLPFFLLAAIGCGLLGAILTFTQLLDHLVKPVIEEIDQDVKDDVEDIKAGRVTGAQVMLIVTAILVFAFFYFFLKLHKIEATWGGLPVYIVGLGVAIIVILIVVNTRWFRDQSLRTPLIIYLIPVAGIVISMWLGLHTENPRNLSFSVSEDVVYNDFTPFAFDFIRMPLSSGFSLDCSDDGCLVMVLIVALVVVTLVLVLGSASIPHFWILSALILLTILAIITIHEWRVRPVALKPLPHRPAGSAPPESPDDSQWTPPPPDLLNEYPRQSGKDQPPKSY